MTEAEWTNCEHPDDMMEFLRRRVGKLSDRKLRLFAVACCRKIWRLLTHEQSKQAVEVAERFAERGASREELTAARADAEAVTAAAREVTKNAHARAYFRLAGLASAADAAACAAKIFDHTDLQPLVDVFGREYLQSPEFRFSDTIASQRHSKRWLVRHWAYCAASGAARWAESAAHASARATERKAVEKEAAKQHTKLLRCILGPLPFHPVTLDPAWLASPVPQLAESIYADRAFDRLPILADALEDAGCTNADILNHCRQPGEHARGCWVVDLLLGKK